MRRRSGRVRVRDLRRRARAAAERRRRAEQRAGRSAGRRRGRAAQEGERRTQGPERAAPARINEGGGPFVVFAGPSVLATVLCLPGAAPCEGGGGGAPRERGAVALARRGRDARRDEGAGAAREPAAAADRRPAAQGAAPAAVQAARLRDASAEQRPGFGRPDLVGRNAAIGSTDLIWAGPIYVDLKEMQLYSSIPPRTGLAKRWNWTCRSNLCRSSLR